MPQADLADPASRPAFASDASFIEDWDRCWPWLETALLDRAFEHKGKKWPTHNRQHVFRMIAERQAWFWPFPNCAFVTQTLVAPTGLRTHMTWLAGGKLDEIVEKTPMIEAWGRARGCHRQVGHGRRGWLRALDGYSEHGVYRQKSLLG